MGTRLSKILYSNFSFILLIVIYRIILDCSCELVVAPLYFPTEMHNYSNNVNYIISWLFLLFFVPFVLKLKKNSTFSNSVMLILTGISLIPTTTLIAYVGFEFRFVILVFVYWLCFYLYNAIFPSIKITNRGGGTGLFHVLCGLLCFTVLYISWTFTGFRLHWGLSDVYDLRMEERDFDINIILKYLHNAANILLPMILIYFVLKRKKLIALLLMGVILLNFGIGGHKSVLFSLVLTICGFYFYKYRHTIWVFGMLAIINFIGIIEFFFVKTYFIAALITNRVLFTPSQLNYYYYDFFKDHELDFFRQSFLRWFGVTSPYSDNVAFMIGEIYCGDSEISANNGLFTDAYSNMGVIGVILFPLILVFIIRFIESVSKGIKDGMMFVVVFSVALIFVSTSFTTALLNNGIILMIIMFYLMPRYKSITKS